MLEKIPVLSAWTRQPVMVPAAPTPVDGLWVGRHPRGSWMIVHRPSQCVVGSGYGDPEAALACAMEIAPLADWSSCPEPRMGLPRAVCDQIDGIVKRWGSDGILIGPTP
jgi:hypothetical protein